MIALKQPQSKNIQSSADVITFSLLSLIKPFAKDSVPVDKKIIPS